MAEANDLYGGIYQNLMDAGCDAFTVENCMDCVNKKRIADMLPFLLRYRSSLLDSMHTWQDKIDCLDFLIYKIKKLSE